MEVYFSLPVLVCFWQCVCVFLRPYARERQSSRREGGATGGSTCWAPPRHGRRHGRQTGDGEDDSARPRRPSSRATPTPYQGKETPPEATSILGLFCNSLV